MKKIIPFILILFGCGNNDQIVISKEEYKKLKGDTIKPEYPKPFLLIKGDGHKSQIILGSDGHEYIEIVLNYRTDTYNVLHSPECIKCKRIDSIRVTNKD